VENFFQLKFPGVRLDVLECLDCHVKSYQSSRVWGGQHLSSDIEIDTLIMVIEVESH
jgi:hypothetical protein